MVMYVDGTECSRGTAAKGGRTSPPVTVRPPQQQLQQSQQAQQRQQQNQQSPTTVVSKLRQAPVVPAPPVAEALAVLVQHLVFNVQAYQVPTLRRQVQKYRLEAEEVRLECQKLEETLLQERLQQLEIIEQERVKCRKDIAEIVAKHTQKIQELEAKRAELESQAVTEKERLVQNVLKQHEEQLLTLKLECEKLQRTHEEALVILREENDSIREQIDQRRMEAEQAERECKEVREEYENREAMWREKNHKLKQQMNKLQNDHEEKLKNLIDENKRLRDENARLLGCGDDDKGIGSQEVQSLKVVLELKQNELTELRRALAEASHRCEELTGAEEKARTLNARCEDLQLQLERKSEYVQSIIQENKRLQEILAEEQNQKRRMSQYNEELQWRLKQTKEVMTEVVQQAGDTSFNRSVFHSSFNERHSATKPNLERRLSFRERERTCSGMSNMSMDENYQTCNSLTASEFIPDDTSLPTSPQVKVMVKKSDSVSYVLDLEESPAVVASRIIRRSFRNSTPPKNTPTKSPSNKRPRIRNPLSQSASYSAIIGRDKNEMNRPHSADARNGDMRTEEDDVFIWTRTPASPSMLTDDSPTHANMKLGHLDLDEDNIYDIQLPALPSEMGNGAQALPTPKHLAGKAMVSESNSEDESTSSSQL
ncbi:unnamed protein product [Acanthoscelides obtectus]|uniref:Uncharacterized protein n=1 Tax=Acanthoscelides obtectus TaxID=200917 RepID=A0A9P0PDI3_ACAOB|nr:unnamed protein product [Acanthoscelides obtectus]CAK1675148.1 Microtubule-associated tumor suppressor 1 homolog [Acanthoscelides obtectus]